MLEPSPTPIHALSSMYECMHICIKKEREGNMLPQGGGSGGGRIGSSVAAQSR